MKSPAPVSRWPGSGPQDADQLGPSDGAPARITTERGTAQAVVEIDDRLRPGHAALPDGSGLDLPRGRRHRTHRHRPEHPHRPRLARSHRRRPLAQARPGPRPAPSHPPDGRTAFHGSANRHRRRRGLRRTGQTHRPRHRLHALPGCRAAHARRGEGASAGTGLPARGGPAPAVRRRRRVGAGSTTRSGVRRRPSCGQPLAAAVGTVLQRQAVAGSGKRATRSVSRVFPGPRRCDGAAEDR
ncbi:molybdopterin dinucleotide binding domain-containing protein [Streptomyces roseolus]|uniref:molybdopterin dinucleotide binding domain-containing protein n=1 Tax=Streptomyces roseolus TaxID=67358 RepID=UPI003787D6A6